MKIAIATDNYTRVAGHAGKARHWLLYLLHGHTPQQLLPAPTLIKLAPEQVMHHFKDDAPHPLDGVDLVVAGSAGEGFIRHMRERGADVLLTGEDDPATALTQILAGEALPDPRFDVTPTLCKLRDLFSRH